MRLDLDSLEALDAVVREGSVARAAKHLGKVQSAVSYQLQALERQLGLPLLDRRGYRVQLTPAGQALLAEGRRVLAQAEQLEALARHFVEGWEPKLTLILDGILPLEAPLLALKALADEGVPTRIQLRVEFLRGVQQHFERERADLMLVKDYEPRPYLQAIALPEVECVLCASTRHPLAKGRALPQDTLQQHVELLIQDSSDTPGDQHSFGGERVFHLSGFEAKKQALLHGLGFGWMPRALVMAELREGSLVEVRAQCGSRYRFLPQLVHRTDRPLGRAGQRLVELLCRAVRPKPSAGSRRRGSESSE